MRKMASLPHDLRYLLSCDVDGPAEKLELGLTSLQLIAMGRRRPCRTGSRSALFLTCKAKTRSSVPSRARATDWLVGFGRHQEHVCGVARCTRPQKPLF